MPEVKTKSAVSKKLILQLAVTIGLLVLIVRRLDGGKLLTELEKIPVSSLLLLVALYSFGQLLSSAKWRIFVKEVGLVRTWPECIKAYFLGMIVNSFGLGTVGGDVTRALAIKPEKGTRTGAFATVIADRLHGLGVLLTIGAIGIAFEKPAVLGRWAQVLAWLCVIALAISWFVGPKILLLIANYLTKYPKLKKFPGPLTAIANAFPSSPGPFFSAAAISTVFHMSQIAMHMVTAKALGADISWGYLFAVIPIVNALSSLPISIQGLGVRESSYLRFFMPIGVEKEVCVAFGVVWFLTATTVSILAALVIAPGLIFGREKVEDLIEVQKEEKLISVANSK